MNEMVTPFLLVGTGNQHKADEVSAILANLSLPVKNADILPRRIDVEETGTTFEENAQLKARAFAEAALELPVALRPRWVLADDSGLCVDALGGRPGVHSSRYAADSTGQSASSEANNQKLLRELEDVAEEKRQAHFVCVLALMELDGEPELRFTVRGECHGRILEAERGAAGFGYDPLFFVPELGRSFGEITPEEKNRASHRGRALELLQEKLAERLAQSK